jgi:hypothetical protein
MALQFLRTKEHRIKQVEMIEVIGSAFQKWLERQELDVPADVLEGVNNPEFKAAELQREIARGLTVNYPSHPPLGTPN